jgi:hypothetical protein
MNRTGTPPEDERQAVVDGHCLTAFVLICVLTVGIGAMNSGLSSLMLVTGLFLTHIVAHITMAVLAGVCLQLLLDIVVRWLGDLD